MLEIDTDYTVFDGTRTVTYRSIGKAPSVAVTGLLTESGNIDTTVGRALKRDVDEREIEGSGGRLILGDVRWELARVQLPVTGLVGGRPKSGDRILDGSETWTVLFHNDTTLETRWRIFARLDSGP